MLFDFLDTRWQRSHRAPVTDDDFTIWVMCHCVWAELDVTKSDHNWIRLWHTKKRWPSKKRHRCVDDTQWCVSHWGSHLTGLAALNEGAFHVLQPEERDTFGLMGDWGEMNGPKQKKTEMFEEEEDVWSLITWTVLEVRPFLDFFQLAIFRRRSHKFSTCASSHSCNGWREKLLNSSRGLCRGDEIFQTINSFAQVLGVVFQTCCVELGECKQIYDRLSGLGANFKPAVKSSPEHNVLRRSAWA